DRRLPRSPLRVRDRGTRALHGWYDDEGRIPIHPSPGQGSGWSFRRPTETDRLSARAKSRSKTEKSSMPTNPKLILWIVGVGFGAFAIGFGVTALSFNTGGAPSDVVMVPDVRELTVEQARAAARRAGLGL